MNEVSWWHRILQFPSTHRVWSHQNSYSLPIFHKNFFHWRWIVIPLVEEDGTVIQHTVTFDIGLAATSGRAGDIGRFKVPQLRGLANNAPYFHDNSTDTIEEVVDYFDSPAYNNSRDGQKFPIDLSPGQKKVLIKFLKIL